MTDTKRLSLHGRLRMAATCPDPNASLLAEAADAIEQHEAFRQEVSDAVEQHYNAAFIKPVGPLARFIIAKADPLVVEAREICARVCEGWVDIPKNRASAYRDGVHDDEADFAYVLNALRKANERPTHD